MVFNLSESSEQAIRVLLVDDEQPILKATAQWLKLAGIEAKEFTSAKQALKQIDTNSNYVLVSDVKMPDMDGLELARRCVDIDRDIPVILITAHGDVRMAVTAMRDGVYDFIEKPFEPELLIDCIQRAWEKRQLVLENRKLRRMVNHGASLEQRIIGRSKIMRDLRRQILMLSETPVDVVINGSTGTGKELVARCLHEWSPRAEAPFVAVNCGAIPENLFESELFGHEAGAFTGATGKRIGKLEYAQGGTIFLDEIESMSLNFQVKLLRVLQERKLERVGSNKEIDLDLWVIAATKVDLREASKQGKFREDLYYRFNIAELHLPDLVDRRDDVPILFEYFCEKAAYQFERGYEPLADEEIAALMIYTWPGNIRELKNIAERFVLGIGRQLGVTSMLGKVEGQANVTAGGGLSEQVQFFESELIKQSLRRNSGNIQAVTEELNLPRRTLNNKMQLYDIRRNDYISDTAEK
jgi:two-component system, NtrC family, C4-dicarboxylate transport response regulator DctD